MMSRIRCLSSLFALVLSVAVLPACDQVDDHGPSLSELDAMTPEELDAPAEDEADLDDQGLPAPREAALDTLWQPPRPTHGDAASGILGVPPPPPTHHGGDLVASDQLIGDAPGGCDPGDDPVIGGR